MTTSEINKIDNDTINSPPADQVSIDIFTVLNDGRKTIATCTLAAVTIALLSVFIIPNTYRSESLLIPSEEASVRGLASIASQFGGLASLAAPNLSKGTNDQSSLAIEIIKSRSFAKTFIEEHGILVTLMAAQGWDEKSNETIIDHDIYNPSKKMWTSKKLTKIDSKPTDGQAHEALNKIIRITKDESNGTILLSVDHFNPNIAADWCNLLVKQVNDYMRKKDILEAKKNIAFLEGQINDTSITEMHEIFYQMIQEQTKTAMLASARTEYVLKTIDKAVPQDPDKQIKPKRALIIFLSLLFGVFIGISAATYRYLLKI